MLSNDFEIGQCLRDQVIPKAVLYFTGEALDYSDVSWFLVISYSADIFVLLLGNTCKFTCITNTSKPAGILFKCCL